MNRDLKLSKEYFREKDTDISQADSLERIKKEKKREYEETYIFKPLSLLNEFYLLVSTENMDMRMSMNATARGTLLLSIVFSIYYYYYLSPMETNNKRIAYTAIIVILPSLCLYIYNYYMYKSTINEISRKIDKLDKEKHGGSFIQESDISAVNTKATYRDAVYPSIRLPPNKSSSRLSPQDLVGNM